MPSTVIGEADLPGYLSTEVFNVVFAPDNPVKVPYLFFTPDRTRILHGSLDGIRVWDLSIWELIKILTEELSEVGHWAHLLNDQIIVSGMLKESYNFWDVTFPMPVRFCTAS